MQRHLVIPMIAGALAFPIAVIAQENAAMPSSTPADAKVVTPLPQPVVTPKASQKLETATDHLAAALFQTDKPADPKAARATAVKEIQAAIDVLGAEYAATARLAAALEEIGPVAKDSAALVLIRDRIKPVHGDLSFRPTIEAPVPPGWPVFTPINEVEIKNYPTYRVAYTTKKPVFFKESRNFWTLFNHISSRNIPMTAPVEMPLMVSGPGELTETGMGFLYPDTKTGKPGETDDGAVTVMDVAPITVVNIGVRGKSTESRINAAHQELLKWLEANKDRYVADGNPRVMGWNAPSMPDRQSYTEVQIPVKAVGK